MVQKQVKFSPVFAPSSLDKGEPMRDVLGNKKGNEQGSLGGTNRPANEVKKKKLTDSPL